MGSESVVRLLSLFNGNLGSVGEVSYRRDVIMRLPYRRQRTRRLWNAALTLPAVGC